MTHGKGVRHQAHFNATADIKHPKVKYLLNFYTYAHWEFLAKQNQLDIIQQVREIVDQDSLISWVSAMTQRPRPRQLCMSLVLWT
jgi:hypothetical protein